MSENLYAAPLSSLDDHKLSYLDDRFLVVSPRKLLVMSFATAGLYLFHWTFKNWALHRDATGDNVWPLPRTIFCVFYTHSLLRHIANHDTSGHRRAWDSDSYATALVLVMLANYALSWTGQGSRIISGLAFLMLIPTTLLTKQVQIEINARCGDPEGSSNDSITGANIGWIVVGAVFWLFALIGLMIPPYVE